MKFNSSGSNVRVNGTADITAGISVSLWVRKFDNPGNRNCSIGTVELNGQKFELSKVSESVSNCYIVYKRFFKSQSHSDDFP